MSLRHSGPLECTAPVSGHGQLAYDAGDVHFFIALLFK